MFSLLLFLPMVMMAQGSNLGRVPDPADFGKDKTFIVGGTDAPEKFPYQVSLRFSNDKSHFCGGSIINEFCILTAGHCVYKKKPEDILIVAGNNNLDASNGQTRQCAKLIAHENYQHKGLHYDVAVICLKTPLIFSKRVNSIKLDPKKVSAKILVIVTGWGYNSTNPYVIPNNLQLMYTTTISLAECNSWIAKPRSAMAVTDKHVCTFNKTGIGACMGDSGGPLVLNGNQVGVVSRGVPCAVGFPDVFSSISYFIDWIKKKCDSCKR